MILFYLAVEGKVGREVLQELFWPSELFHERSNANLRVNLTRLRKDLPSSDFLKSNKDTIWLNPDLVSIDALDFLNLVEQPLHFASQFPASTLLPNPMVSALRRAVELWRSPSFLSGFSISGNHSHLEQWLESTAWRFKDTHSRALTCLAGHFYAAGDLDAAIQWTDAALEIDPWSEKLQIQKIHWLLGLNRTSAALDTIQYYQDQYGRENEEVPEELAALFHTVRRQVISIQKNAASEDWPGRLLVQVPLVGRRQELMALQTAFRRGGTAVVWGQTGSGKTRLLYEFHRSLQPRPRLLVMNAIQGETKLAFQPWIDALRRSISQDEWRNLAPHWLQPVSQLLPELDISAQSGSPPQYTAADMQPGRLYEALHQVLLMISRSQRVLVVLDSAQWCDPETLSALAYLGERRFFAEHGLLVITACPELQGSPLENFLSQQSRSPSYLQINLPPFNLAETEELVLQVLDEHLEPRMLERLAADTGGIPLFLLETLYGLLEYAPSSGKSLKIEQLPVGASIHNFLRRRLEKLSLPARQVVEAAAVLEPDFNQPLLAALTPFDQDSIVRSLDELHQAGLIETAADRAQAAYQFVFGQLREVIRWELGPARLRLLHLRAAHAIEEHPDPSLQSMMMLARHYEEGGDLPAAVRCWVKAGLQAHLQLLTGEALLAFQAAERLVQRSQVQLPEDLLDQMYTRWGEIAYHQNDADLMERLSTRLVELGEERQSASLLGNGLGGLAQAYSLHRDTARSMEMFQRATYHLQQLENHVQLVQLYIRQGWYLVAQMRYDEAVALLEKAYQLVGEIDDPRAGEFRTIIEVRLGMVYNLIGWPLKAQDIALRSLGGDPTQAQTYGHLVMAAAKFYMGENIAALEHTRLGLQLARRLHSLQLEAYMLIYQIRAELKLGQVDAAWSSLLVVNDLASKNDIQEILTLVQILKGEFHRLLGDLPGALAYYRAGMEASAGKWDSLDCQLRLGSALAQAGKTKEGLRLVDEGLEKAREINLGIVFVPGLGNRAVLLVRAGRLDEAIAVLDEHQRLTSERNIGLSNYFDSWVRFQVSLKRGDLAGARRQADLAFQTARQNGDPFHELAAINLQKLSGAEEPAAAARVKELLALIDRRVRHPDLRRMGEAYIRRERAAQST